MKRVRWVRSAWVGLVLGVAGGGLVTRALGAEGAEPALKYEEPRFLRGTIYAEGGSQPNVLFRFTRRATRTGSRLKVEREFSYPDGRLAAREHVLYEGDALRRYELEELQIGATGSASLQRSPRDPAKGSIDFDYTPETGGRRKSRREELVENTLIADMVGPFLQSRWDALMRGEKVKCRYIVVPRRETVGFTFVKDSQSTWKGREALVIRMEASSRLVAAMVPPLFFTLEKAPPHRVLQYRGRTTPKLQAGGKWKDLDAVTVFEWDSAR